MPTMDRFDLQGKTAIVCGSCGTLGPIWCDTLEEAGAKVIRLDLPDFDVRDQESVTQAVTSNPLPDILVVSAGYPHRPDQMLPTFEETLSVNLVGAVRCCETWGQDLKDKESASIICIGSQYSVAPARYWYKESSYIVAKHGIAAFVKQRARDWGKYGVRINVLSPGGFNTFEPDDPFLEKYAEVTPMQRMAEAEDLKGPLLFLASDASRYMTGQNLVIDGGFSL
jgi:NAD(P)-dependent dehydrogenase (short-subunit alcohol dehydrogenase family)